MHLLNTDVGTLYTALETTNKPIVRFLRHHSTIVVSFLDNAGRKNWITGKEVARRKIMKFYYFLLVQKVRDLFSASPFVFFGKCERPTKSQASHCLFQMLISYNELVRFTFHSSPWASVESLYNYGPNIQVGAVSVYSSIPQQ